MSARNTSTGETPTERLRARLDEEAAPYPPDVSTRAEFPRLFSPAEAGVVLRWRPRRKA